MTIVVPVAIADPALPLPDPADRATFTARKLELLRWEKETLAPGAKALGDASYSNALDAQGSASAALSSKNAAAASETNAAASAATATAAPATNTISTTSLAVSTGAKTLTVQTGKAIVPGMQVLLANTSSPSTQFMRGPVTGYNSGTGQLDIAVDYVVGAGTVATWTVSLTGVMPAIPSRLEAAAALTLYQLYGVL